MKVLNAEQHKDLIAKHRNGWSFQALANYFGISKTSAFFYYHGGLNDKDTDNVQAPSVPTFGRAD